MADMRSRALGTWIAAVVLVGGGTLAVRAQDADPQVSVSTRPGPSSSSSFAPGTPDPTVATDLPPASSTTAAAGPPSTTAGRSGTGRSSSTTAPASRGGKLVATAAQVSQPGMYVVGRDGTALRRVAATCGDPASRQWLDESTLLVYHDGNPTPEKVRLDGSHQPFTLPSVTGPSGELIPLRGVGSLSPDRHQMAMSFAGTGYGVAIVDLDTQQAVPVLWGDNPTPTWSPTGEVLLVFPDKAVLQGPAGVVRTMAPAPLVGAAPLLSWSPDGRQIVGPPSMMDMDRRVVVDPHAGTSRAVPSVGQGGANLVTWAGSGQMVIADPGVDHRIAASLHVWDLGTGKVRDLVVGGWSPSVPADGQVVAFIQRPDESKLDLVSIAGTGRSTLVQTTPDLFALPGTWSPSGRLFTFDACSRSRASGGLPVT
jgi:hypothetical protein